MASPVAKRAKAEAEESLTSSLEQMEEGDLSPHSPQPLFSDTPSPPSPLAHTPSPLAAHTPSPVAHTLVEHTSTPKGEGEEPSPAGGGVPSSSSSVKLAAPPTRKMVQGKITAMLGRNWTHKPRPSSPSSSSASPSPSPRSQQTDLPPSRGCSLSEICFGPSSYPILPPLLSGPAHCILFRARLKAGDLPRPFPDAFKDVWDSHHVRMPCSSHSLYPVRLPSGEEQLRSRWEIITEALRRPLTSSHDLEKAILSYNSRYAGKWNFQGLHAYFSEVCDEAETAMFFGSVLPRVVELALSLPRLVTHAVPLLQRQQPYRLSLSQQQTACLLANALFCTFPRRNASGARSEYARYPSINFSHLFSGSGSRGIRPVQAAKLKCLFHYFARVTSHMPEGVLTFSRQVLHPAPQWERSEASLTKLRVDSTGTIEDNGHGMLQVDFANRFVGGGVLGGGCVQEEIRFLVCPELMVSRLFTEALEDNECLVVTGAEQFSSYHGYSSGFEWAGSVTDSTVRDGWGRRQTVVVAMDALHLRDKDSQFKPGLLRRELNKAYCGFMGGDPTPCGRGMAVATGNWGCGAFGGDVRLKALLQLMAAAVSGRDVVYFTFGDRQLQEDLFSMHRYCTERGFKVRELWAGLLHYHRNQTKGPRSGKNLYDFIYGNFQNSLSNTASVRGDGASVGGGGSVSGENSQTVEYRIQ